MCPCEQEEEEEGDQEEEEWDQEEEEGDQEEEEGDQEEEEGDQEEEEGDQEEVNLVDSSDSETEEDVDKLFESESEERDGGARTKAMDARTKRERKRRTWQKVRARLPRVLKEQLDDFDVDTEDGSNFFDFVQDIARMYNNLQDDTEFHLTRQDCCLRSITSVFNDMPAVSLPYEGSTEYALSELLPVLEAAFNMPSLRPKRGMHMS